MNVLVRGLGSIGARHARIATELGHMVVGVSGVPCDICPQYPTPEGAFAALGRVDLVVIATATAQHAQDVAALAPFAAGIGRILVEKPLVAHASELAALHDAATVPVFVAYNLRHHPCIVRLRELLAGHRLESLHLYVGQYLPSWRPGIDYRGSYSASSARGGGVLRDLSHELDLACLLAGPWLALSALGGHISHLEIDCADVFTVVSQHAHCAHVTCHMNYLDRMPQRRIVANTAQDTIVVDLIACTVQSSAGIEHLSAMRDTTYLQQMQAVLSGDTTALCSLEEGTALVRMIEAIEQAAREHSWVRA